MIRDDVTCEALIIHLSGWLSFDMKDDDRLQQRLMDDASKWYRDDFYVVKTGQTTGQSVTLGKEETQTLAYYLPLK